MDSGLVSVEWDLWRELCYEIGGGLEMECSNPDDFRALASVCERAGRIAAVSVCTDNIGDISQTAANKLGSDMVTIQLIEEGYGVLKCGDEECVANPGDLVIRDWTRAHSIKSIGTGIVAKRALIFTLPRRIVENQLDMIDESTGFHLDGKLPSTRIVADYFRSLERNFSSFDEDEAVAFSNSALEVLGNALSLRPCEHEKNTKALIRVKSELTERLWDSDMTIHDVADSVGMTPRTIQRLFQSMGTTPSKWVEKRRIERIASALQSESNASRSITSIAFEMGFNDLSTFSRAFKRNMGMSPRQFRRAPRD